MNRRSIWRIALITMWLGTSLGMGLSASAGENAATQTLTPRQFFPLVQRKWSGELGPELPLGVSDRTGSTVAQSTPLLLLAAASGTNYNRTAVSWRNIESTNRTPAEFDWREADDKLNPLFAAGIQPFVLILDNPAWAATTPCGPPYDANDLAEVMGALAARYPQVPYWGLYNEVDYAIYFKNFSSSGGCFGEPDLDKNGNPDYADYAELMRAVWSAIHAANPNAKLAFGNLAYDNFTDDPRPPNYPGGCCFDYHFLDKLMEYIATHPLPPGQKYGDVLGFNDYWLYNEHYWEKHFPEAGVGAKAAALRQVMANFGQDFPLVITEMSGYNTIPTGVTQAFQARQTARMMTQGIYYDIKTLIWWTFDEGTGNLQYGLVDHTQTPKLAYYAFQTAAEQLRGFSPYSIRNTGNVMRFTFRKGELEKRVYYTKKPEPKKMKFDAKTLLVTDMLGNRTFHRANAKGKIKLWLTPDPIYVEINP